MGLRDNAPLHQYIQTGNQNQLISCSVPENNATEYAIPLRAVPWNNANPQRDHKRITDTRYSSGRHRYNYFNRHRARHMLANTHAYNLKNPKFDLRSRSQALVFLCWTDCRKLIIGGLPYVGIMPSIMLIMLKVIRVNAYADALPGSQFI